MALKRFLCTSMYFFVTSCFRAFVIFRLSSPRAPLLHHPPLSTPPLFSFQFPFSTPLSRLRSCRRGVQSRSGRSDPQLSTVSGCCPNERVAPLPQCGSQGPPPTPDSSSDRHTDLRLCSGRDSPPRSEGRGRESGKGSGG